MKTILIILSTILLVSCSNSNCEKSKCEKSDSTTIVKSDSTKI